MVDISKMYDLEGLHKVVVQKGNVGGKYIYALQLLTQGTDAVVYRASKGEKFKKGAGTERVYLYGPKTAGIDPKQTAGGYTQTWEYAGTAKQGNDNAEWFIGTKSKYDSQSKIYWDTQIARIPFGKHAKLNTKLPRISNLNQAGRKFGLGYDGGTMVRSEAAVSPSPNYSYFLIATVDSAGTGYFSVYNLTDVNNALNSHGTSDVNLKNDELANLCLRSFKIEGFVTDIGSIQGYDIDDNLNIYISSEAHPNEKTHIESKTRKIVKIPWGATDPSQWDVKNLDGYSELDEAGYATEFEGIQVNGENDLYLTVAYHSKSNYTTEKNKIFRVIW